MTQLGTTNDKFTSGKLYLTTSKLKGKPKVISQRNQTNYKRALQFVLSNFLLFSPFWPEKSANRRGRQTFGVSPG